MLHYFLEGKRIVARRPYRRIVLQEFQIARCAYAGPGPRRSSVGKRGRCWSPRRSCSYGSGGDAIAEQHPNGQDLVAHAPQSSNFLEIISGRRGYAGRQLTMVGVVRAGVPTANRGVDDETFLQKLFSRTLPETCSTTTLSLGQTSLGLTSLVAAPHLVLPLYPSPLSSPSFRMCKHENHSRT